MPEDMQPDYKQMYLTLFDEVTVVIEKLKNVQKACEEIFIDTDKHITY